MNLMKLTDYGVQAVLRKYNLRAKDRIGRGAFSVVYAKSETSVLKLTSDDFSYMYLTDPYAPSNEGVPKVIKDHGCVGEDREGNPLYLVELERLFRVSASTGTYKPAHQITALIDKHRNSSDWSGIRALESVVALDNPVCKKYRSILEDLTLFMSNFGGALDLKISNFMARSDGTLVLSDPVFDRKRYQQAWAGAGWH